MVGQRLMQTASDIFLGWQRVKDIDGQPRDYYVRQLHDWKGSAHVDTLWVDGAITYARMCGATLARAHARSGDWIAIASYLGKGTVFDGAMADFSAAYADQNERDYEAPGAGGPLGSDPGRRRPVALAERRPDRCRIVGRTAIGSDRGTSQLRVGRGGRRWSPKSCRRLLPKRQPRLRPTLTGIPQQPDSTGRRVGQHRKAAPPPPWPR